MSEEAYIELPHELHESGAHSDGKATERLISKECVELVGRAFISRHNIRTGQLDKMLT